MLGIERVDGSYFGVPQAETVVEAGDVLVLYSRAESIAGLDQRQSGRSGDAAHEAAPAWGKTSVTERSSILMKIADRIIAAAEIANVDAIHPGYGFLSENARFADILAEHDITFIGPSADHIRTMGR